MKAYVTEAWWDALGHHQPSYTRYIVRCGNCGQDTLHLTWDDDNWNYTGRCETCAALAFIDEEEFMEISKKDNMRQEVQHA